MAKFYYQLRDTNSTAPTPIILVATFKGLRIKCKTDLKILPKYWNIKDKTIIDLKDLTTETKDLIKEIERISKKLSTLKIVADDTFNYFEYITKSIPTWSEYSNLFYKNAGLYLAENTANKPTPEQIKETLLSFVDKIIEQTAIRTNDRTKKTISKNTIKVFNQCKRLLNEFHKTVRKIDFESIDLDFYHDFKEFMIKKEYAPNTISKHIGTLKTILNEATERGINTNLAFKSKRFSTPKIEVDTIYFNDNELNEIYNKNLSEFPKLERARDLFLVGCYTGLRFGDWSIKPESIKGNFIEVLTEKTNETVLVPIHPKIKAIMAKYEGKYANCLPPSIANQNMNLYLKEVCAMVDCLKVDINKTSQKGNLTLHETIEKHKLVTTHTARRSFATNLYLQGFPTINIMKLTGHRTEKSFLKYIKITPTDNAKSLELHWNKLEITTLKIS